MKVGQIPSNHFDGQGNTTRAGRVRDTDLVLAELLDLMQVHRVPGNIETAAFTAVANDTWEDTALVAALNTALDAVDAPLIRVGEAVHLSGTLEIVNAEVGANNLFYGHGGTPDNDDTRRAFTTAAAIGSEFIRPVDLLTDADGNVKIETDDIANLTLVFHLEGYQYVRAVDSSA
jgi:hypothetical protein